MRVNNNTLARLAKGRDRLIGPSLVVLLAVFVYVLFVPLLITKVYFLSYNEIVLLRVAYDLFYIDAFLFVIVFAFGIVAPLCKMGLSILCWYRFPIERAGRWSSGLMLLGKLAMMDIMLLAILIVAFKGIGSGVVVQIRYGLYIYAGLVTGSFLLTLAMAAVLRNCDPRSSE